MHRRSLWKSTDELVEEFFRAYLEMEWVSAVLHADIKELYEARLVVLGEGGA